MPGHPDHPGCPLADDPAIACAVLVTGAPFCRSIDLPGMRCAVVRLSRELAGEARPAKPRIALGVRQWHPP